MAQSCYQSKKMLASKQIVSHCVRTIYCSCVRACVYCSCACVRSLYLRGVPFSGDGWGFVYVYTSLPYVFCVYNSVNRNIYM